MKKKKEEKFPYVADPEVEQIVGQPESAWELVNRYGTYEVQATQDTDNLFPTIAQGYPSNADPCTGNPWAPGDDRSIRDC